MAAVDGIGSSTPTTTQTSQDVFSGMGPDAFLKLLVAQLRYQNPMNPSDPTAMMGQVAQYAQVEALTKMQTAQATEQSLSEAKLATEMVGKTISASDGTSTETGKVMSARFTSTGPVLILDTGAEVTLSAVVTVTSTDTPATSTSTGTSTGTSTSTSTGNAAASNTTNSFPTVAATPLTTDTSTAGNGSSPFSPASVASAIPDSTVSTVVDPSLARAAVAAYSATAA